VVFIGVHKTHRSIRSCRARSLPQLDIVLQRRTAPRAKSRHAAESIYVTNTIGLKRTFTTIVIRQSPDEQK
jgi:hypothetical protein